MLVFQKLGRKTHQSIANFPDFNMGGASAQGPLFHSDFNSMNFPPGYNNKYSNDGFPYHTRLRIYLSDVRDVSAGLSNCRTSDLIDWRGDYSETLNHWSAERGMRRPLFEYRERFRSIRTDLGIELRRVR